MNICMENLSNTFGQINQMQFLLGEFLLLKNYLVRNSKSIFVCIKGMDCLFKPFNFLTVCTNINERLFICI